MLPQSFCRCSSATDFPGLLHFSIWLKDNPEFPLFNYSFFFFFSPLSAHNWCKFSFFFFPPKNGIENQFFCPSKRIQKPRKFIVSHIVGVGYIIKNASDSEQFDNVSSRSSSWAHRDSVYDFLLLPNIQRKYVFASLYRWFMYLWFRKQGRLFIGVLGFNGMT